MSNNLQPKSFICVDFAKCTIFKVAEDGERYAFFTVNGGLSRKRNPKEGSMEVFPVFCECKMEVKEYNNGGKIFAVATRQDAYNSIKADGKWIMADWMEKKEK